MQTYIDCYPCFLRQSIEAARMAGATQEQQRKIVLGVMEMLKQFPSGATPPEMGLEIHKLVRKITGNPDPYLEVKQEATEKALRLLPKSREKLYGAKDKLETALRLSIAGNIIDFGLNKTYDLWEEVKRVLQQGIAINDTDLLREKLQQVDTVLFLADNAGETVFDRLLIETIAKPVTYVVKGSPVLNDAIREDAIAAEIDRVAEIIDSGVQVPGTILGLSSSVF